MKKWISLFFHVCLFSVAMMFALVVSREGGVIYQNAADILEREQVRIEKLRLSLESLKKNSSVVSREKDKFQQLERKAVFSKLNRVEIRDIIKKEASGLHLKKLNITMHPVQSKEVFGLKRKSTPIQLQFESQTDKEVWQLIYALKKNIPGIVRLEAAALKRDKNITNV